MLRFFRINDPYRILAVMFIMALIRIPYYIWGTVLTESDVLYFQLGEKIASGEWIYTDFISEIPPLTAIVYGILNLFFGKSLIAFHLISFLLTGVQVYLFNDLVSSNRATDSQTYIPGFVYGVLISFHPALYTLTPVIMSLTFILFALNYQFNHLEFRVKRDEKMLSIGFYMGTSALLFNPSVILIITVFLVFAIFTNTVWRRYLMILYGYFLPALVILCLYILKGDISNFMEYTIRYQWYDAAFYWEFNPHTAVVLAFLVISWWRMNTRGRFTNYQSTLNQAMFIWFFSSLIIWTFFNRSTPGVVAVMIPPVAFYVMHFFSIQRPGFWASLYVTLFILLSLGASLTYWMDFGVEFLDRSRKAEVENPYMETVKDKSILVLAPEIRFYHGARQSTAFFNYNLVSDLFSEVNYENLGRINRELLTHQPEIIIDPQGQLTKFMKYSPALEEKYEFNNSGSYWVRVSN